MMHVIKARKESMRISMIYELTNFRVKSWFELMEIRISKHGNESCKDNSSFSFPSQLYIVSLREKTNCFMR
jgi:hypothetical protein